MIQCAVCGKEIKKTEASAVFIRRPRDLKLKDKFNNGVGSECRTKLCAACAESARRGQGGVGGS